MDDPGPQTNWQSLGPTLDHEFRYVTHLDPRTQPANDAGVHKQRLNRAYSTRSSRSKEVPTLHRHTSMRLTTRLKHFVHRLTWRKRSKSYLFGKQYLQRQPSFVMTPDRSSYTYRFRARDLVKSRPHPRYERSSQPIAAWKHANPMNVLLNKGQVAAPQPGEGLAEPQVDPEINLNTHALNSLGRNPHEQHASVGDEPLMKGAPDAASHNAPRTWQKVSLPIKQDRTSSSSQEHSGSQPGEQSTPRNTTDQSASGSGSKSASHSRSRSRSHVSHGSPSVLDLPPTPLETRKPVPKAVDLPSRSLPFAADSSLPPPRSPTSARSKYRPESWRRSAVVTRNERIPEDHLSDLDIAIEFVGAWGTYLKRAIAVRAVAERKRKSWEQHTERRWSYNMPYDSDFASSFESSASSSATRSEDYEVRSSDNKTPESSSNEDAGNSSTSGTPSGTGTSSTPSGHDAAQEPLVRDSASWHADVADYNDQGSLPDAGSESSFLMSGVEDKPVSEPAKLVALTESGESERLSSASIQQTPEAISRRSLSDHDSATQASGYPRSPMRSTSSLAPPNSPRALAAMARTSAERKRFSDSIEAAEKRYSVLFQQDSGLSSPSSAARTVVQNDLTGLNEMSQWQPEDSSDKETGAPSAGDAATAIHVSALRVRRPQAKVEEVVSGETLPDDDEFDFTDLAVSRKRPLPVSPVSTPAGSNVDLTLDTNAVRPPSHRRHSSGSLNSGTEDAPSLLKSQSVRKHLLESSHKRVKSSVSRENLLLMRQNTLRSRWAEEDSDSDDSSERFEANKSKDKEALV